MADIVDARTSQAEAVAAAVGALRGGHLVVVPTDTVYGVAADAFNPAASRAVFTAKRRDRSAPLPVLVRSPKQVMGLVTTVEESLERLMAAWWPGPLTIVVRAEPNLAWDLGDNDGTVAVRMPFDDITLAVIREIGPLAVTSANLSGNPPATTAAMARVQLGEAVKVIVDGGARRNTIPSTMVDLTRRKPAILRAGPLDSDEVLAVATGDLAPHEATPWTPPEVTSRPAVPEAGPHDSRSGAGSDATAGTSSGAVRPRRSSRSASDRHSDGPTRRPSRHVARDHRGER